MSHANIRERVHAVASRGIVPVVLGGDHSITWPAATAVADVHGYGNVGIVHFDAHADTADEIEGNLASHGTPMRRLIESGAVPGTHFVQVGLRGYWPPQDTFEWMLEQGMTWHTMQEIWDRGFKEVMRDAVGEALAKADKLYVSVDIDVLDPAHAPGTGTPEPGGITSADLLRLVRQLCYEHDVAGVDVVEVAPAYDHAELTVKPRTAWCSRRSPEWPPAAATPHTQNPVRLRARAWICWTAPPRRSGRPGRHGRRAGRPGAGRCCCRRGRPRHARARSLRPSCARRSSTCATVRPAAPSR